MALSTSKNTTTNAEMAKDFYYPTSKKALIIFTRNPQLGKVKTRLAKTVGDESALKIYKFLLNHTVEITKNLQVDKFVFYSETIVKNDIWNKDIFKKKLQSGDHLGEKMKNAFAEIFSSGYEKAIIIGSDMYDLSQNDLENAFDTLNKSNTVIGPATDGGYYLLGMKSLISEIFQNKNWGTSTVLSDTLANLKDENYVLLDKRNDIDYFEDVKEIDAFQHLLPPYLDKNFL